MSVDIQPESQPLFLPSMEDEDLQQNSDAGTIQADDEPAAVNKSEEDDWMSVDAMETRAGNTSNTVKQEIATAINSSTAIKNTDTACGPSSNSTAVLEQQARKKRKVSPTSEATKKDYYLGSFLVPNAWSTTKGSGYIKPGDYICVEREQVQYAGQSSNQDSKQKGKGRQVTLFTMLKPQGKSGASRKNKSEDTIVRLTNERGFGE